MEEQDEPQVGQTCRSALTHRGGGFLSQVLLVVVPPGLLPEVPVKPGHLPTEVVLATEAVQRLLGGVAHLAEGASDAPDGRGMGPEAG